MFREFARFAKSVSQGSAIAAQGLAANRSSGGEKIVLCVVFFAYSLLSLLLSLVVVVLVSPLLSY